LRGHDVADVCYDSDYDLIATSLTKVDYRMNKGLGHGSDTADDVSQADGEIVLG
jgi:hypothetical protein